MAPLWETTAPFALFMFATVVAAWLAGVGPGILTGAIGLATRIYFDSPRRARQPAGDVGRGRSPDPLRGLRGGHRGHSRSHARGSPRARSANPRGAAGNRGAPAGRGRARGRARERRRGQPAQGRVPGHGVARAADAAQCDSRVGRAAAQRRAAAGAVAVRARDHPEERQRAGQARHQPARYRQEPHRPDSTRSDTSRPHPRRERRRRVVPERRRGPAGRAVDDDRRRPAHRAGRSRADPADRWPPAVECDQVRAGWWSSQRRHRASGRVGRARRGQHRRRHRSRVRAAPLRALPPGGDRSDATIRRPRPGAGPCPPAGRAPRRNGERRQRLPTRRRALHRALTRACGYPLAS